MEMRMATADDFLKCISLGKMNKFTTDFRYFAHLWRYSPDSGDSKLMVIVDGDKVIGGQYYKIGKNFLAMYYTMIHPDYQGQGHGGSLFSKMIDIAVEENLPEIVLAVRRDNERAYEYYKGFGIYPAHFDKNGKNYLYHISLRNRKSLKAIVDDRNRKPDSSRLLVNLRLYQKTGVYDWLNCSDVLHTDGDPKFVSLWGTSNSGKTTMLKQLISHSGLVETYPPYFTLLDDGVVIVGVCNPALRSQGGDSLVARFSYSYFVKLVDALWMVRDVRVLVAESYLYQGRHSILNLLLNNKEKRDREIFIFHTQISNEDLDKRLFESKGKHLTDYKGEGKNFFEKRKQVETTINKHRLDDNFNFIDVETVNTTVPERYEHFIETIGLDKKWLKM